MQNPKNLEHLASKQSNKLFPQRSNLDSSPLERYVTSNKQNYGSPALSQGSNDSASANVTFNDNKFGSEKQGTLIELTKATPSDNIKETPFFLQAKKQGQASGKEARDQG